MKSIYPPLFSLCALIISSLSATPSPLPRCGSGVGAEAITASKILLVSGKRVSLIALIAPIAPATLVTETSPEGSPQNKTLLNQLIRGKRLIFRCEGSRKNYRGDLVAHVFVEGQSQPISLALVEAGTVMVYPFKRQNHYLTALYKAENQARAQNKGLWQDSANRAVQTSQVKAEAEKASITLVRGTAVSVSKAGKWLYLNFGDKPEQDFTLKLSLSAFQDFIAFYGLPHPPQGALDQPYLDSLFNNQALEMRGKIYQRGGPMMTLTHAGRLVLLPEP